MDTLAGRTRMNGYSMHYYENGSLPPEQFTPEAMYTQFNLFPRVEQSIIQQRALLDSYDPNRGIGLFLDEWGVWDRLREDSKGRLWQQSTMRSAVGAALGLNLFNRQADKLYMCNIAQLINVLQSVLLTDGPEGRNCVRTTTYYAFMLFKPHRSKTALRVETDGPKLADFGGRGAGGRGPQQPEPLPDLSVSASRLGPEMAITFVNPRHDVDMQVDCALRGVTARQARARILHHPDINAFNSFDQPDQVVIKPHEAGVEGAGVRVTLPSMSVVTVTLEVA
jgi:alpha-N-arabinofuranosidase